MSTMVDESPIVGAKASVGNKVVVRVFANNADGEVVFTHDWKKAQGKKLKGGAIVLPADSGGWELEFQFYDATGGNLEFPDNAEEAMWTVEGKSCPKGKGNGGHITYGAVSKKNGKNAILTVTDDNDGDECDLTFALRFKPDPQRYIYDPEIKNGGKT